MGRELSCSSEGFDMVMTSKNLRVLLVDDQPMIAEAVRRCLMEQSDIDFLYCQDPLQAIPTALEFRPTVILQDLVMPGVDGLQLLSFFRAHGATWDIPMVMLSSKEEAALKAQAFALGANDYLVKLPDAVELIARIRYHSLAYIGRQEKQRYLKALEEEQERSQRLLLNVLPHKIAEQLKVSGDVTPESFTSVSVLFADIVGFTEMSQRISPVELVHCLNQIFSSFDDLVDRYQLEKIKTVGDSYMVVSGVPTRREDHATRMAHMALEMQRALRAVRDALPMPVEIRTGFASGPVVAGIVGSKKFIYDLWGDTVNTASRMESHGITGEIQMTEQTYELVRDRFICERRGKIEIKGKGEMVTYLLKGER
jgi:adenylate cyclase